MDEIIEYVYIYALIDPRDNQIRYVGKTVNPKKRYQKHIDSDDLDRYPSHKSNWIKLLKKQNLKPIFKIIEEVPIEEWENKERYWIKYYRDLGCNLTNMTDGGEGCSAGLKRSEETKTKMKKSQAERMRDNDMLETDFYNLEKIPITEKEMNIINQEKNLEKRKFLVALLIINKINDESEYSKSLQIKLTRRMSKVKNIKSKEPQFIKYFEEKGLLKNLESTFEVLFKDTDGEPLFYVGIDAVDNFFSFVGNISSCECCGKTISKTYNQQKYCCDCRMEIKKAYNYGIDIRKENND